MEEVVEVLMIADWIMETGEDRDDGVGGSGGNGNGGDGQKNGIVSSGGNSVLDIVVVMEAVFVVEIMVVMKLW